MGTQKQRVALLLETRGFKGVSAHELVYEMGITRGAAIVHELRQEGVEITTIDEGDSKLARYVLTKAHEPVAPVRCGCGHSKQGHIGGLKCAAALNPGGFDPIQPCPCEKYHAA